MHVCVCLSVWTAYRCEASSIYLIPAFKSIITPPCVQLITVTFHFESMLPRVVSVQDNSLISSTFRVSSTVTWQPMFQYQHLAQGFTFMSKAAAIHARHRNLPHTRAHTRAIHI